MSNDLVLDADRAAPSKFGPKLTEPQKRAIVASYATNGSMSLTAHEHGVHRNTVANLVNSVRNNVPDSVLGASWRTSIKTKAITSVTRALDDDTDTYKSGAIGVQVLKGLGEFNQDQAVNVTALVTSWPADLSAPPPLQVDGD